jgi:hypothetical protein
MLGGKLHPSAALTLEQARAVRAEYVPGVVGYRKLARKYNVEPIVIKQILWGITYREG